MSDPNLNYYEATYEIWVKPLFRKSRPKIRTEVWAAHNYEEFLWLLRGALEGKRWILMDWRQVKGRPTR